MSAIVRNIIQSALKSDDLKIAVMNIRDDAEIADFDFTIYSLDNPESQRAIFIDQQTLQVNRCIYFDAIINLRPFDDSLPRVLRFQQDWQLPIYNYIVDINQGLKPEIRMRKAEAIQKFANFIATPELAAQIYLPNAKILSPRDFSNYLQAEI